jgi:hypothetical protein
MAHNRSAKAILTNRALDEAKIIGMTAGVSGEITKWGI